jgi:hypothetical protein
MSYGKRKIHRIYSGEWKENDSKRIREILGNAA